ncbi:FHA domain-containing protein, partial [Streptomyces sp. 900116325]
PLDRFGAPDPVRGAVPAGTAGPAPSGGRGAGLGRSTEADVRIDDPGVSRRHCEIRTGTPSTIQDLGSTNGIVVDGQHTTRATLRDGSRIVVGSTTIVYRQAEG